MKRTSTIPAMCPLLRATWLEITEKEGGLSKHACVMGSQPVTIPLSRASSAAISVSFKEKPERSAERLCVNSAQQARPSALIRAAQWKVTPTSHSP